MVYNLRMTKNFLKISKLTKDLPQIECFQCCLSIENSNSLFYFETKWLHRTKYTCRRELANKTDNYTVSDKEPKGRNLTLIRLKICRATCKPNKKRNTYIHDGDCTIIWYPKKGVKHTWQVYVTSELKIKLFCFYFKHHCMNFRKYAKQIYIYRLY